MPPDSDNTGQQDRITTSAACRECGVEADACCADIGYPCCWFCTVTRVAHAPSRQEAPEWTI